MSVEHSVGQFAGETEILVGNLPQCHSSITNPTNHPGSNPDRHGGKPATNHLSYGDTYSMPPDDGHTTETCCGNNIRGWEEELLRWRSIN
jgi:hypothetical protein